MSWLSVACSRCWIVAPATCITVASRLAITNPAASAVISTPAWRRRLDGSPSMP
ncbi:hypothetical protein ACFQHO_07375 [Actinomadura yumaensis]|uniref:hypothetical protein n=1 Tax=Actinomadura yumaensis TaxID=111807 RepID=UPI00362428D1